MIKNNFRILKKQYAYLQTILKTPVKFQKDWPKSVGGVADTRMVVGADGRTDGRTDRRTDGRMDTQNFGGYNIIPRHFLVAGHKKGVKEKSYFLYLKIKCKSNVYIFEGKGFLAVRWRFSLNTEFSEVCWYIANIRCTCSFKIPKRTSAIKFSQNPKFDIFVL